MAKRNENAKNEARSTRKQPRKYGRLVLVSIESFSIGLILAAFKHAFGFGGLLIVLLLCLFSAFLALHLSR